ncbi:MAG: hypothetical protein ACTSQE_02740 [Candidatus Heimdallarchaeaceae archaeon]
MSDNIDRYQKIASKIEEKLKVKTLVKEKLLQFSRELIKVSGKAITNVHSKRINKTEELLNEAKNIQQQILEQLKKDPTFTDTGYVLTAFQEFAEAQLLYGLVEQDTLFSPEEISVTEQAYLLAVADLIGELRRHILEHLISDQVDEAKRFYDIMKELYGIFLQIEVEKNLISDFRRKKDTARMLIEKTLSDLFIAIQGKKLENKLKSIE